MTVTRVERATSLWRDFFCLGKPQIRAFHMSWFAFFLCFFAWFGIAPLMPVIRRELQLTDAQIGNTIIASVAMTVFARLLVGWLCDRIGPRRAYSWLLVLGSLPVMGIGFSYDYTSFLVFRLLIGAIGASFVITQYHTSVMFAPNVVGTANATSAGWGNLGGGATNIAMPLVFAFLVTTLGLSSAAGWRVAMIGAGVLCLLTGLAYSCLTQDTPAGNFEDLQALGELPERHKVRGQFWQCLLDRRVWVLAIVYGACFGIELTMINVGALYFADQFQLSLVQAGLIAGSFGLMNLFARTLGGILGDRCGRRWGLKGRVTWLFTALMLEGIVLMCFSQIRVLSLAIIVLLTFSLFVQMAEGATFAVVPFVNPRAVGMVAGIVGAGGNAGAVLAGFLFRGSIAWSSAFLVLGALVLVGALATLSIRFSPEVERETRQQMNRLLHGQRSDSRRRRPGLGPA